VRGDTQANVGAIIDMRKVIVGLFLIGNVLFIQAQSISGKIVDDKQALIEFANIIVLNPADSSLITGTMSSESGTFLIENISPGQKLLKISYIGYLTQLIPVEIHTTPIDLGEIRLPEDIHRLNEVVVSASAPPFSRKGNSLVANVSASLLSSVGTAQEVIGQIPGVSVRDNAITVFGKGAPVIYINNRKLYNENELQQLQSSGIATIELITNPGAKYDAGGRAVFIIKTRQNEENGWAFQVSERLRQGNYFGDKEDAGLTYNREKLSLFASYAHEAGKSYQQPLFEFTIHNDTLWRQLMNSPQLDTRLSRQFTAGIDWSITKRQAIGGQYQGSFDNEKYETYDGTEEIRANDALYDKIATTLISNEKAQQHLLNAFYQGDYSDSFGLRLDMDYMHTEGNTQQQVTETSVRENRLVNLKAQSNFNLYAGKLTATYRLGENSRLEGGAEYNRIEGSGFLINPEQYIRSNIYTNTEEKTAGFAGYSNRFGKLDFQLGVRYEFVHSKATEDSVRRVKTDRTSHGFYPNLSLSQIVGKTQMGLEFSQKTQRPVFSQLNGIYYINRFLTERGNPYLKNEDIYQIDYHLTYRVLDFTLGYVYKKNPLSMSLENGEEHPSQTLMVYTNYPEYQEINALLTANFEYKIWKPRITTGLTQPFFSLNYLGEELKYKWMTLLFQFHNEIVFPKDYIFSINFEYSGKSYYYMVENGEYKTLQFGLRKSFLDKKLSVNLQVNDPFRWEAYSVRLKVNNISYFKKTDRLESRYAMLTISYRFNNYKKKYRGENAAGDDIRRL
jgi:hypothetical protein